ncbi:MAG: class I adenylate-forming enzyme family protein, partial [Pseudomonadota bacterium]
MPADTAPAWPAMSIAQANQMLAAPESPVGLKDGEVGGVALKIYANAPATIRDILLASAAFGPREMIIYEDERVNFTAHMRAVEHFAKALRETFGVQPGDRVAVIMRNYPQWSVAFFAALAIGAIATPMNSWWTGEELEYGLGDSGAKVAVVDAQIFERINEHRANVPTLEHVVIARDSEEERPDPRVTPMEAYIGEPSGWASLPEIGLPDADIGPDSDATIMYTSGTTGRPKGALATHRAIVSNMFNSMTCQARMFLRRGEQPPEPDPNEQRSTLLAIPFFHATGAFAILIPALLQGNKIVSMYKWDADKALPIIEHEKITAVGGVPAIAWQILEHPDRDKYDLSSIAAVSYGGAPS